jgi:uncharacterized iron-regulated membrane protein
MVMMQSRSVRNFMFQSHRYIGLAVGIVLAIVGLTGSLLVFHSEISDFTMHHQFGTMISQAQPLPLEVVLEKTKAALSGQANVRVDSISPKTYHRLYQDEVNPVKMWVVKSPAKEGGEEQWAEAVANPYSGELLKQPEWEHHDFFHYVYELHYKLLAGNWGMYFVGVVGLLSAILCLTGIALWPGWRKFFNGFKIKWDAKPKRLNFDVHKVAGIIAAVFLFMATFTGFLWNFWDWSEPATYTVLFSKKPADAVSQVIPGRSPITFSQAIEKANVALPGGKIESVTVPAEPKAAIEVRKNLPQDVNFWGEHSVYLDQYSGDVVRVATTGTRSFAEKFMNAESTVHYGTFWGIPSRLLYVFVGLSPTILLVTGFVMWNLRKKSKPKKQLPELIHHS